ncbi:MAG: hypothetical protein HY548_02160 [Elusimicrobia bacterium]|nr:hypothetical protein [Elusimicrobiota bacterium]
MIRFGYKTVSDWQRAVENFRVDISQPAIKIVDGTTPLDLVDDFNDGVLSSQWKTSADFMDFGEAPVETGGFLQFEYPNDSGEKLMEVAFNSARGGVELETRFLWENLGPGNSSAHQNEWGIAMLQGAFFDPPMGNTDFQNRLLWELTFAATPGSGILSILPVVFTTAGKKAFSSSTNQWENFSGFNVFGFNVGQSVPMSNIPVTFIATKGPGGGMIMKAYRNDDPNQVFMQTTESPPLRSLSGDIYLDIARSHFMHKSRYRFDYFKLSGQPIVPPTGFLRLRDTFPQRVKATHYSLSGDVSQGGSVQVQFRAGDTVQEVEAAPFSDPLPLGAGEIPAGAGVILETQITLVRGLSMSPTVSGVDIDYSYDFLEEDRPLILSLNEVGRRTFIDSVFNSSLAKLVADKDPSTQWQSTNNTDGFLAGVAVQFLDATGFLEERLIDTLILLNTNYRTAFIRLLDINQSVKKEFNLEFSGPDVVLTFEPTSTAMFFVSAYSTNPSNHLKKLGEVYAGRLLSVLPNFDKYEPKRELFESGHLRTLNGNLIAYRGSHKFTARWGVSLVDAAKKDELEKVYRDHPLVTFYPEPKARPRDIFDVAWKMESMPFPYTERLKTAGFSVDAEMIE